MEKKSSIVEFYNGRSVFVTGATGFMGKVLIEKLLRSCAGIERIYILLRPAPGKDVSIRLQEFVNNQVFDNVKKLQPHALDKVVAVSGDITMPGYGLSTTDLQLLIDNVSVVFNSAATVKFDEELKAAININVRGPKELLEICRKMKRLEALVHVSTAFNNLDQPEMKEEVQPSKVDPVKLMELLDCLDNETLQKVTGQLVGRCPNTYTYTKALAEHLLWKECGTVPLAIVRPSIVTAALKEPVPGWIDNINGPTGAISGVGKGFLRVMKVDRCMVSDIIPVDYPINLMIAVAWHTAVYRPNEVAVYSCTTSQRNPLTWGMLVDRSMESWLKYPPKDMVWYPGSYFTTNELLLKLNTLIYHKIPAYILDFLQYLMGERIKWVRMYEKAHRAFSCLVFFTTHQWRFISNNPTRLMEYMSAEDREVFYFDVRTIDWKSYFDTYILGARKFILKDDIGSLTVARKNLTRLFWIRTLFRIFLFSLSILAMTSMKRVLSFNALLRKDEML